MDHHKVQEFLIRRGLTKLGGGAYSDVFAPVKPPSDRVIKVNRGADNWPDYVLWAAKQGYAGNFAPRVYSIAIKWDAHGPKYLAVVERLACTILNAPRGSLIYEGWGEIESFAYRQAHKRDLDKRLNPEIEAAYPGIEAFIIKLGEFAGRDLDLHRNNAMLRHDGSLCFTDPVYGNLSDYTPKRLRAHDFSTT